MCLTLKLMQNYSMRIQMLFEKKNNSLRKIKPLFSKEPKSILWKEIIFFSSLRLI